MREPDVSIVLPVYNAASYLATALDSVLAQTFRDFEIVAVDDGSTDRSGAILKDYSRRDARVRLISRPNTGIVGALNDGVAAARGKIIARMDADDFSLPMRIEKQLAFLDRRPECVAVGTDVLYTDPEGSPLLPHRPAEHHDSIVMQLLDGNGGALIHPSIMFRRDVFEAAGGYREHYQWIEDLDLYLRFSERGELANLPEVHLHYRQHLQSVNYTRPDRNDLRMELVNPRRGELGLPPLIPAVSELNGYRAADWRRHWAYDAARGGNWTSARKNARKALVAAPFDWKNWQCARYVLGALQHNAATAERVAIPFS